MKTKIKEIFKNKDVNFLNEKFIEIIKKNSEITKKINLSKESQVSDWDYKIFKNHKTVDHLAFLNKKTNEAITITHTKNYFFPKKDLKELDLKQLKENISFFEPNNLNFNNIITEERLNFILKYIKKNNISNSRTIIKLLFNDDYEKIISSKFIKNHDLGKTYDRREIVSSLNEYIGYFENLPRFIGNDLAIYENKIMPYRRVKDSWFMYTCLNENAIENINDNKGLLTKIERSFGIESYNKKNLMILKLMQEQHINFIFSLIKYNKINFLIQSYDDSKYIEVKKEDLDNNNNINSLDKDLWLKFRNYNTDSDTIKHLLDENDYDVDIFKDINMKLITNYEKSLDLDNTDKGKIYITKDNIDDFVDYCNIF